MNLLMLILLLLVLVVPTFMMQRRQRQQLAKIQKVQEELVIGDRVITSAGLHAVVRGIEETTVDLEVAPGLVSRWEKAAVMRNITQEGNLPEHQPLPAAEETAPAQHPENIEETPLEQPGEDTPREPR